MAGPRDGSLLGYPAHLRWNGFWRLHFVVLLDGEPIGMQDLKGVRFHQVRPGFHVLVAGAGPAWARDRDGDARSRTAPWDTRRGEAAPIQRRRLTRDAWDRVRRDDIELVGVQECLPALGLV
jgi:hypothetical protein